MKKYCFLLSGSRVWFEAAKDLYERKIARPVFWLGDDILFDDAKNYLGK